MKSVTTEELRTLQMEQLVYIDKVCRQNNIEYTLAGGTLLGAIRHGGYIPWDDDIDVEMTRPNYERLISLFIEELPENLSLIHYKTGEIYTQFAKLYDNRTTYRSDVAYLQPEMGVFLDIFPIDNLPSDEQERKQFKSQVRKNQIRLRTSNPRGIDYACSTKKIYFFGKTIVYFPAHLKNKGKNNQIAYAADSLMQKYNKKETGVVGFPDSHYQQAFFPVSVFSEYEDVSFEDITVRKIVDHDSYLKQQYGDYMVLPPEDKRVDHSYYQWFWK